MELKHRGITLIFTWKQNIVWFQGVTRTSDVRVSNRVNKSEVTLNTFPTVYNDLIGEVSIYAKFQKIAL